MRYIIKAALVAAALAWPLYADAAGTINLSLSQQFDAQGRPLTECKLYFIQAGTVDTPQNAYSDVDLTSALPNPLECDASGRLQQFFLADGKIKVLLTDKNGAEVLSADNVLVIGSAAGGGSTVDPNAIYQTGDIKARWGTGVHSGWVRANGRTIGSASSGATERANSDTQTLWEYICTNDTTLRATISGGYSGSCANDYAANKTIQLPDYRGRNIAGLGDMGNSATTDLTSTYCGADPTVLGQACGAQSKTLAQANLPSGALSGSSATYTNNDLVVISGSSAVNTDAASGISLYQAAAYRAATDGASISGINLNGSGTAFATVAPSRLTTIYIKL